MYCSKCGKELNNNVNFCRFCGAKTAKVNQSYQQPRSEVKSDNKPKSKLVAGILGIVLGMFGVHRFYLGYTGIGLIQLCLNFVCLGAVSGIWGFIEGVLIIAGSTITTDAKGIPLEE